MLGEMEEGEAGREGKANRSLPAKAEPRWPSPASLAIISGTGTLVVSLLQVHWSAETIKCNLQCQCRELYFLMTDPPL